MTIPEGLAFVGNGKIGGGYEKLKKKCRKDEIYYSRNQQHKDNLFISPGGKKYEKNGCLAEDAEFSDIHVFDGIFEQVVISDAIDEY